ncbi:hypothetical protein ACS5PN_05185 [Roseateles sp. NT4]|uniref:hypothetical protein n=1 Tax=Roseateles sp. NT4 TaxID=3453715 RepID=UPI003EEE97EB
MKKRLWSAPWPRTLEIARAADARQFIEKDAQDDNAISQLSLTYRFEPTAALEAIKPGNLMCEGAQASAVIRDFAAMHPACLVVADQRPKTAQLHYSRM